MSFTALREGLNPQSDPKLQKKIDYFQSLTQELEKHESPQTTIDFVNQKLAEINAQKLEAKKLLSFMRKSQIKIFQHLEKDLKLVRKGHYRMMWMALGMGVFGVPLGIALGFSIDNLGMIGVGLPIGMGIGIAVGTAMDAKAAANGKQLDLVIEN